MNFGADDDERLTPFEEDKPKCAEITPFKAGSDSMLSAMLVHRASICISYQTKSSGGTAYTVKYAEETEGIPVLNVRHMLMLDKKEMEKMR